MATKIVFANQPSTQTTGTSGTTTPTAGTGETWTVSSNAGFPTASGSTTPTTNFHICDPAQPQEIILVNTNPSTTWTVTRGAESSTVARHGVGATFYQIVSAADYGNFLQAAGEGQSINPGTLSITNASTAGAEFTVTNTSSGPSAPSVQFVSAASSDVVLGVDVAADADFRWTLEASGLMQWSSGAAVSDVTLARTGAGVLTLNPGSLTIQSGLTITSGSITVTSGNIGVTAGNLTLSSGTEAITDAASAGAVFQVTNTTTTPTAATVEFWGKTAADKLLGLQITGDTVPRLAFNTNGAMAWGAGGSSASDVTLSRSSAGNLTLNPGSLTIQSNLTLTAGNLTISAGTAAITEAASAGGVLTITNTTSGPSSPTVEITSAAATDVAFGVDVASDADFRFTLEANGTMQWGSGSAGSDVTLDRSGAGVLTINPGALTVNGLITGSGGITDTGTLLNIGAIELGTSSSEYAKFSFNNSSLAYTTAAGGAAAGLAGFLPSGTATDFTSFTITSTVANQQASKAWSIPANDAVVGTKYRLTVAGHGTTGSSVNGITTGGTLLGSSESGTGFAGTATAIGWKVVAEVVISATGTGGTYYSSCIINIYDGNFTGFTGAAGFVTAGSINTTTSNTLELTMSWTTATGSPTLTSDYSQLERIGP